MRTVTLKVQVWLAVSALCMALGGTGVPDAQVVARDPGVRGGPAGVLHERDRGPAALKPALALPSLARVPHPHPSKEPHMKMIVAALIGGVVLGFLDAKLLASQVQALVTDPGSQGVLGAGVAAFLGGIWGWVAKGVVGGKPKE